MTEKEVKAVKAESKTPVITIDGKNFNLVGLAESNGSFFAQVEVEGVLKFEEITREEYDKLKG